MKGSDFSLLPGNARGWPATLHPSTRLLCGLLAFAAVVVAPGSTVPGRFLVTALPLLELLFARISLRRAAQLLGAALLFYLPFLLLTLLAMPSGPSTVWSSEALAVAWKGSACVFLAGATLWTLSLPDLHAALRGVSVPEWIALLTVHILHQTESLLEETRRITQAIEVRAGGSRILVLRSLPLVWLPRILFKADRVAMAMEVRGYNHLVLFENPTWRGRDFASIAIAFAFVGTAVLLRAGWLS